MHLEYICGIKKLKWYEKALNSDTPFIPTFESQARSFWQIDWNPCYYELLSPIQKHLVTGLILWTAAALYIAESVTRTLKVMRTAATKYHAVNIHATATGSINMQICRAAPLYYTYFSHSFCILPSLGPRSRYNGAQKYHTPSPDAQMPLSAICCDSLHNEPHNISTTSWYTTLQKSKAYRTNLVSTCRTTFQTRLPGLFL